MNAWKASIIRYANSIIVNQRSSQKKSGRMADQIGNPDIMILFTNTVSHRMVHSAVGEAERKNIEIIRSHSSSGSALNEILTNACHNA